MNETLRRVILNTVSGVGWAYAVGISAWAAVAYDHTNGRFAPQWAILSVILVMGAAIAAGAAVGRMNSIRTLTRVFDAGRLSARIDQNSHRIDVLAVIEDERRKDDDQ